MDDCNQRIEKLLLLESKKLGDLEVFLRECAAAITDKEDELEHVKKENSDLKTLIENLKKSDDGLDLALKTHGINNALRRELSGQENMYKLVLCRAMKLLNEEYIIKTGVEAWENERAEFQKKVALLLKEEDKKLVDFKEEK